jgi:hypothetical protein
MPESSSMLAEFEWAMLFGTPFGWLSIAVVAGVLCSIATAVINNWRRVRESEHLTALKQSMIERGMSADEIERVLAAGSSRRSTSC